MDRKGIIAVTLALTVMVLWQVFFAPKPLPPPPPAAPSAVLPAGSPVASSEGAPVSPAPADPTATGTPAGIAAGAPVVPGAQPTTEAVRAAESLQRIAGPAAEYVFTNLGGGIEQVVLLEHTGEKGSHVTLNEQGTLPIGAVTLGEGNAAGGNLPYNVTVHAETGEIVCERTEPNGLKIVKKFTLPKSTEATEEYLVTLEVSFSNGGAQALQAGNWFVHVGSASPIHTNDLPINTRFDWFHAGEMEYIDVHWFDPGSIPLIGIQTSPGQQFYTQSAANVAWAAVTSQYFTTIVTPVNAMGAGVWAQRSTYDRNGQPLLAMEGALRLPGFTLAPGQTTSQVFRLYAGPKIYDVLKKLGQDQDEVMLFGMFKAVSKFLLNSMNWLHSFTGSYAAAIILLTLVIRSAMWPLQNKATASMKKMQALQPKMTELREKYKDDPAKMNQELMKLYKDYGVNPFGGCLPMLVQIPVFFGFYSMLGTAVELRNSRFLWVDDLSQPDTVFHLAGIPVNILPLLMAATMVWQMHLTPKTGDAIQQRVFMFVPLIFVFFCYNFASALALYWTVQNLFSIVQLWITRDKTAPVLKKTPATARTKVKR